MRTKLFWIALFLLITPFSKLFAQVSPQDTDYVITLKGDTVRCTVKPSREKWRVQGEKKWHKLDADSLKGFYLGGDSANYFWLLLPRAKKKETQSRAVLPKGNLVPKYNDKDESDLSKTVTSDTPKRELVKRLESGRINLYEKLKGGSTVSIVSSVSGFNPYGLLKLNSSYWYAARDTGVLKQIITSAVLGRTIGTRKERIAAFIDMLSDNPSLLERFTEAIKTAEYSFELVQYYIKTYNDEYKESHPAK